jgi:hypothetical protein
MCTASSRAFAGDENSFLNGDSGEFLCTSFIRIAAGAPAAAAALAAENCERATFDFLELLSSMVVDP